ncbi:LPS-assembly protein LptD [Sulfurimonas sp.]
MRKVLLLLIATYISLFGGDKVEIYATSIDSKDGIVKADGGVTVVYKEYFLSADRALYYRKNGDLELFGHIRVNHGSDYKILGSYAKLNIAKKERFFKPFYFLEKDSQVWISAGEGSTEKENIEIHTGTISGCDPIDPLWTIEFSSTDYNANSKWLNIYNARLYIYDIPVLYTPYFGYSLDTTRRTGLLMPSFGLSDSEGIYYEQPFYIAEYNSWDLELKPQIRTKRGYGIYSTLRFVDSAVSHGELTAGYFKEYTSYYLQQNLQKDSHFGFNFKYDNKDFINQWFGTSLEGQNGIYADINHMNDVDYINLETSDTIDQSTATQVLSRINMFYNNDDDYLGAYFKYYLDLTLPSNDNTLQKLPTLQYHHYLDTLLEDHFLYSLDIKSNNIYREINKKVIQTDMNLPIKLRATLFDEYINLAYTSNLYMQYSSFSGEEESVITGTAYEDGYYVRNYHTISASTQLTRAYENMSHVIGFDVTYNRSSWNSKSGYYQNNEQYCSNLDNQVLDPVNYPVICEFYNITDIENETKLEFTQYLYNEKAQQVLYHRVAQKISYSSTKRYGELENELEYSINRYFSIYNNMFFNYDESKFSKIFNKVSLSGKSIKLSLSHLYKDSFLPRTTIYTPYTSYVTSSFDYEYSKHYSYNATYNYDIEHQEKKSLSIGFLYKKRCWDFGIKYSENNRPVLTQSGESSIYDKYVYLTIVLKPLMQPSRNSSFITYKLPNNM